MPLRLANEEKFKVALAIFQLHKSAGDGISGRILHHTLNGGVIFRGACTLAAEE
jgi:hypothetical protein